ncbi:hypothetical protein HMPREF9080_01122 [Cardiobacterium valvarum F0432]|uniref:Uncharacterized protein n=1 Tax=Cardiobacterium valvarum F0432 TaxID=797473 RepID=G9ZED7_9GAMM|nr:hypothetical protein HMPREF9080_01122 [Cardiobacterium valvarum F0432]
MMPVAIRKGLATIIAFLAKLPAIQLFMLCEKASKGIEHLMTK